MKLLRWRRARKEVRLTQRDTLDGRRVEGGLWVWATANPYVLNLSVRTANLTGFHRLDTKSVRDATDEELLDLRGIGPVTLAEIRRALEEEAGSTA